MLFKSTSKQPSVHGRNYLSLKESAEFLGIKKSTMQKISAARLIPVYKPNRGKVYFLIDDLEIYILSGRKKSRFELMQDVATSIKTGGEK